MESLALVVSLMLLGEVLLGLVVIVFAVMARFKGKFHRTSLALIALGIAIVLRWWPRRLAV